MDGSVKYGFIEGTMRIGMMADVYKPHISGITNYITFNKSYLEKEGHEVFVFTFGDEDYPDDEERVIRSPGLPLLDTGYYISLRYSKRARRLVNTMDVVHVHHPFLSGSLALRYCRPRGIPIVFTNHTRYDLYAQAYLPGLPDVIGTTAIQAYMPPFARGVDLVIAPSPGMRDVLVSYGVDVPIEVVPNGVDIEPFLNPTKLIDRQTFGIKPEDIVLIYSGRLGPEKNLPFLMRSFGGVSQAYQHVHLFLVGDGPERENLKDRIRNASLSDRVHFIGMVPYLEIPGYLTMADVFVTASVTEVHPLSVIEAMAAGLPVLGIKSPGVGDTVQDGETGFLAMEEDLASFTAKMVRLVVDTELRQRMSEKARQMSENYAIERTTHLMLDCYQRAIHKVTGRKNSLRARLTRWYDGVRFRV
jgi:1,2-diacylglycerol 3-alpha-glucosyltransferase